MFNNFIQKLKSITPAAKRAAQAQRRDEFRADMAQFYSLAKDNLKILVDKKTATTVYSIARGRAKVSISYNYLTDAYRVRVKDKRLVAFRNIGTDFVDTGDYARIAFEEATKQIDPERAGIYVQRKIIEEIKSATEYVSSNTGNFGFIFDCMHYDTYRTKDTYPDVYAFRSYPRNELRNPIHAEYKIQIEDRRETGTLLPRYSNFLNSPFARQIFDAMAELYAAQKRGGR